jgi:hypothetical protein
MNESKINFIRKGLKKWAGLLLFILCIVSIYYQVGQHPNLKSYKQELFISLRQINYGQWMLLLLLMGLNLSMEAIKWRMILKESSTQTFLQSLKSIFIGQAFAFYTPNRIGEYVGRTLHLPTDNKLNALAKMAWTSYAQLLITIVIGSIAVFIQPPFLVWIKWVTPFLLFGALFVYFQQIQFSGWLSFLSVLQIPATLKTSLLFISLIRYFIFIAQYYWVAQCLQMGIPFSNFWVAIAVLFLCLSILPTISITELVVRGQIILLLFAPFYQNTMLLIGLTTIVWVVNLLLPAIIGSFLLLSFKFKE